MEKYKNKIQFPKCRGNKAFRDEREFIYIHACVCVRVCVYGSNVILLKKWASHHLHFIGQIHFLRRLFLAFFFLTLRTGFKAFGKSAYSAFASWRILPQNKLGSDEMVLMNFPISPFSAIYRFSLEPCVVQCSQDCL